MLRSSHKGAIQTAKSRKNLTGSGADSRSITPKWCLLRAVLFLLISQDWQNTL